MRTTHEGDESSWKNALFLVSCTADECANEMALGFCALMVTASMPSKKHATRAREVANASNVRNEVD